jgi:hypothetical protein
MVFHMLRRSLGDAVFLQGLRRFYRDNLFTKAGFADLEYEFSAAAGESLAPFFHQWVERPGAPQLEISEVKSVWEDNGFHLSFTVQQAQPGDPYALRLPLAITLEGHAKAWQTTVSLARASQQVRLAAPARPLHVEVDPHFDLFRRLHPAETPPSISQALGARELLVVLPDSAPPALKNAYRSIAETWRDTSTASVDIVTDAQISQLPTDRGVWLLGWHNAWRDTVAGRLSNYEYSEQPEGVTLVGHSLLSNRNTVVVMTRPAGAPSHALGWLAAPSPAAVGALARKLHHYGRYSYLAFEGQGADNILRGQWPVLESPLSMRVIQADGSVPDYQRSRADPDPALLAAPAAATQQSGQMTPSGREGGGRLSGEIGPALGVGRNRRSWPPEPAVAVTTDSASQALAQQPRQGAGRGDHVNTQCALQGQMQCQHGDEAGEHKQQRALIGKASGQPGGHGQRDNKCNADQYQITGSHADDILSGGRQPGIPADMQTHCLHVRQNGLGS